MRLVAQDSEESRDQSREPGIIDVPLVSAATRDDLLAPRSTLRAPRSSRGGFTLIEMLLVLVIILALAGLLLAAVFRATLFGKTVSAANDVQQLGVALQNFKTQFGFYPPSKIRLCKRQSDYKYWQDSSTGVMYPLEADSVFYISKMAARITDTTQVTGGPIGQFKGPWACTSVTGSGTGTPYPVGAYVPHVDFIDWDNTGSPIAPAAAWPNPWSSTSTPPGPPPSVVLEGDQCLVFFLGGMPATLNGILSCTGFSKNQFNPAMPRLSPNEDRFKFYDFDSGRLAPLPTSQNTSIAITRGATPGPYSPVFPSYLDQEGQLPFLYFSSYRSTNGYNRYFVGVPPTLGPLSPLYTSGPWSDCQSFGMYIPPSQNPAPATPTSGVWPYLQPSLDYQNSETYQLLSAGGDKKFGLGVTKNTATAAASIGSQTVNLAVAPTFGVGQRVAVDTENSPEVVSVTAVNQTTAPYSFTATFSKAHSTGFSVYWQFWTKGTAGDVYATGSPGADDIANFSEKPLGTTVAVK
jgi:prepilin-type N-terminal cleavage/methylation domain-containing protein